MLKRLFYATLVAGVCAASGAYGSELKSMKTVDEAVKLAASIPAVDADSRLRNVAEKMKSIGMTINGGRQYAFDTKAELEQPSDKIGDIHFTLHTGAPSEEFQRRICHMSGDPAFLKRNGKFYPESRTANWLMYGDCSTKFPVPR